MDVEKLFDTGASFIGLTVTVISCESWPPSPSLTIIWKSWVPKKCSVLFEKMISVPLTVHPTLTPYGLHS